MGGFRENIWACSRYFFLASFQYDNMTGKISQIFKHVVYADQMQPIRLDGLSASPNK